MTEDQKRCEYEANWFAAAFLMPEKWFREQWETLNCSDTSKIILIADKAKVSAWHCRLRAEGLGLVEKIEQAR